MLDVLLIIRDKGKDLSLLETRGRQQSSPRHERGAVADDYARDRELAE